MAREILSPIAILDETPSAVVRVASPWLGVVWPALIPLRFLQVHFARDLFRLGGDVEKHGGYLGGLALTTFAALLVSVWGRVVFVRAVRLGLQSGHRVGGEAIRTPLRELATALYTTLLCEVLFFMTVWFFFLIPLLLLFTGLAFATAHRVERPGLLRPLLEMARLLGNTRVWVSLLLAFGLALLLAFINLYFAFRAGVWLGGSLLGSDLARWQHLLRPGLLGFPAEPLTFFVLMAGTVLVVEPFWLAALAVYVHRSNLRETGEDLRLRFRQLTRSP
jgi:hypothetical protein